MMLGMSAPVWAMIVGTCTLTQDNSTYTDSNLMANQWQTLHQTATKNAAGSGYPKCHTIWSGNGVDETYVGGTTGYKIFAEGDDLQCGSYTGHFGANHGNNIGNCTGTEYSGGTPNGSNPVNNYLYTPTIGFVDSQGTVHQDGVTYDSTNTAGQAACDAVYCTVSVDLKLTNAGTDSNTYAVVISLPQPASTAASFPAQGGNGDATMFNDNLPTAVNGTINACAGCSWAYVYIPTSGGQAVMPKSDVTNTFWLTSTFKYRIQ